MSISSTSASNGVSGFSAALRERIQVHDDEIDRVDALRGDRLESSGRWRRARMPPWIAGCSVLTRPSIISGNPVTSETLTTGSPASASALAVPPVEMSSTPQAGQTAGELDQPGLVGNTQNCAHIVRFS